MTARLTLASAFTVYQAPELQKQLLQALDDARGELQLDGSCVHELDGAGVQILLALAKEAQRRDIALPLHAPSPTLLGTLRMLGLTGRFRMLDVAAEAVP